MSINAETRFYLTKGMMTMEQAKKLNDDREFLDLSLLIGNTTDDQLYRQIKVEMGIFDKCLEITEVRGPDQNNKHIKLLILMLFDRINNMYSYMFSLFPINAERANEYIQFCTDHLPIIFPHKYR
ncbi:uncharacterized protein LOC111028086 [Myzus persicae]|uniref:uncharacterized protein LOC111028086 n=1 Tax=Myzus persicae TaxID=13164 RepID=UPI000B92FCEE|nr:uncharacterized protein LOC111028086 [Myzus persicae]